jgi:hypothetical protein
VNLLSQDARAATLPPNYLNQSNYVRPASPNLWRRHIAPLPDPNAPDPYTRTFNGLEWSTLSTPLPTVGEAEDILKIFRNEALSHFPFISIPQSISADELRREKPFTYLAVIAITSIKLSQQMEISRIIIKQVAERVFMEAERNIDLLFGILTFTAWFVPQSNVSSCFYSDEFLILNESNCWRRYYSQLHDIRHLTALAAAAKVLVFDLGLLRVPLNESHSLIEEALYKTVKVVIVNSSKTLDEKRALLGYFILSSK